MDTETKHVAEKLSLVESKLYVANREENYLEFLEPSIDIKMAVEIEIDQGYPRTDEDGDDTRIFINYTNLNGQSLIFKVNDSERLARTFDVDTFLNGYFSIVNEGMPEDILLAIMPSSLVSVINSGVVNALELANEKMLPVTKKTGEVVLQSFIATLLNDPLDAIILIKEQEPTQDNPEPDPSILGLWTIKHRD